MWCGRRSSPESASSTYVFFLSLSCARRMPRRDGEVFRFGTAIAGNLLGPRTGEAGLIVETRAPGKPSGWTGECLLRPSGASYRVVVHKTHPARRGALDLSQLWRNGGDLTAAAGNPATTALGIPPVGGG